MWFWPLDERRTMIVNRAYTYKPKNLGERLSRAYFRSLGRDVVREDLNTLEAQQAMLGPGAIPEIVLSRRRPASSIIGRRINRSRLVFGRYRRHIPDESVRIRKV